MTLEAGTAITGNTATSPNGGEIDNAGTVIFNPGSDVSGNTNGNRVNDGGTGCP